jgi:hypothetical protein
MAVEKVYSGTEKQSQRDPKSCPEQGFLKLDNMSLAVEDA